MAYLAPNEDTIIAVGGLGTQADKAALNGGGATKVAWNTLAPAYFIGTNGGPKTTGVCAFTTATKNLAVANIGFGVIVGTLCYVSTGDGAHIFAGIYEITSVPDDDNIVCSGIQDDGNNDTGVTVNVGGALDSLQNALDNPVNNVNRAAGTSNRYIYDNIATETIGATVDVDTFTGAQTTHLFVIGYNSTLAAETEIIITTAAELANGLVDFSNATLHYTEWWNIDFNAGGKDASKAHYGVYNSATGSSYHVFRNCKFRGAKVDGFFFDTAGLNLTLAGCEASLNGQDGFNPGKNSRVIASSSHDNDRHGFNFNRMVQTAYGNLAYDNGKDGTGNGFDVGGNSIQSNLIGNTAYGNADDGFQVDDTAENCILINNASIGNSAYGYDLQGLGIKPTGGHFSYNLAGANTTAHYSEGADNTFADFRHGNNVASAQTADQLLKTITDGSEDFTPETGSDLIDAGLDAEGTGEQDIGAIQQAAGAGGGLMFSAGMTGGFND